MCGLIASVLVLCMETYLSYPINSLLVLSIEINSLLVLSIEINSLLVLSIEINLSNLNELNTLSYSL